MEQIDVVTRAHTSTPSAATNIQDRSFIPTPTIGAGNSLSKEGYDKDIIALKDKANHLHALCDQFGRSKTQEVRYALKTFIDKVNEANFTTANAVKEVTNKLWNEIINIENYIKDNCIKSDSNINDTVTLASGEVIKLTSVHKADNDVERLQLSLYAAINGSVTSNGLSNMDISSSISTKTFTCKFNKTAISSATATYPSGVTGTSSLSGNTLTGTVTNYPKSNFTVTVTAKESDGSATKNISVSATWKAPILGKGDSSETAPTSGYSAVGAYINNVFASPSASSSFTVSGSANQYLYFAVPSQLGITSSNVGSKFELNHCGKTGGVVLTGSTMTQYGLTYTILRTAEKQLAGQVVVTIK